MNEKLRKVVADVLGISEDSINSSTSVENEPKWDSLRHMNLIFAIEDAFQIRLRDDEIPVLTSVEAIEKTLASRQ